MLDDLAVFQAPPMCRADFHSPTCGRDTFQPSSIEVGTGNAAMCPALDGLRNNNIALCDDRKDLTVIVRKGVKNVRHDLPDAIRPYFETVIARVGRPASDVDVEVPFVDSFAAGSNDRHIGNFKGSRRRGALLSTL